MKKIDVTSGLSGYPQNVRSAFVDFDNFAEVEKFAKLHNTTPAIFKKRDGWPFWEYVGMAFEPFDNLQGEDDDACEYLEIANIEEWANNERAFAEEVRENEEDDDAADAILSGIDSVLTELAALQVGQVAKIRNYSVVEINDRFTLISCSDVWTYKIGVEIEK